MNDKNNAEIEGVPSRPVPAGTGKAAHIREKRPSTSRHAREKSRERAASAREARPDGTSPKAPRAAAPSKKKPSALKAFIALLIKLVIIAALGWAVLTFVLGVFVIHSNDMYPAARDGDLLITYRLDPPARGAVIAYTVNGERRFGRVVGMAGDVIDMDAAGHYTLNGGIPYETIYYVTALDPEADIEYPYTVPEGTVFVLNDLRENTGDSRRFGAIPISDTDGSAALLLRRRGW